LVVFKCVALLNSLLFLLLLTNSLPFLLKELDLLNPDLPLKQLHLAVEQILEAFSEIVLALCLLHSPLAVPIALQPLYDLLVLLSDLEGLAVLLADHHVQGVDGFAGLEDVLLLAEDGFLGDE